MPYPLLLVIGVVVGAALGALIAYVWLGSVRRQRDLVSTAEREKLLSDAETQMKEMVLEAKEEAQRIRMSLEQEVRDVRAEIQRSERRVQQKEESIDRKLEDLDRKDQAVTAKELEIGRTRERVNDALAEQVKELERISGMTRAEARTTILTNLEKELNQEIAQKIREGEEIVKQEADKPARIEEMVVKARNDVQNRIREEGEQAMFETGVTGLHPELVKLLGTLAFRTSYGQNVLTHSKEVSFLCGMAAAEIGADVALAREAGLLHDIGKAIDHEVEGSHAIIGGELLRRLGRAEILVNAVAAHHMDVEPTSLEAILTVACDAVSAARPGARRETLTTYIKRLEKLESIANSFEGVEKSFAIQAGREIRIIVKPDTIDDSRAQILARDIAKRIEGELSYPGQIKVTVIRETRIIEFAK